MLTDREHIEEHRRIAYRDERIARLFDCLIQVAIIFGCVGLFSYLVLAYLVLNAQ